jgi:hypothetical protein
MGCLEQKNPTQKMSLDIVSPSLYAQPRREQKGPQQAACMMTVPRV